MAKYQTRTAIPDPRARIPTSRARVPTAALVLGVLIVALAGLLSWSRASSSPAAPTAVRLVSDCSGSIRDWVLCLPDRRARAFVKAEASLISQADARIRFHVLYAVEARRADLINALKILGYKDQGQVLWHKSPKNVWPWPRDLFLAASSPDGQPLVLLNEPGYYGRSRSPWDHAAMGAFAKAVDGVSITTDMQIEGGAIVVDDARVLVSSSYMERAASRVSGGRVSGRGIADVIARRSASWGRPVEALHVGDVHPSHHCDFAMMPAGDGRMVLASPVLGAKLLAATASEERLRFQAAFREVALGAPEDRNLEGRQELDVVAAMLERNSRPDVQRAYRRFRATVEKLGYECVEVPLLALNPAEIGVGMTLSYANAVIDEREGERVVYLPTYQLPTLDRAATEVWRKLGFRVVAVEALGAAWNGGGIHCLSQVFRASKASARE